MKILSLLLIMSANLTYAAKPNIIFIMLDDMDILDLKNYEPNSLIHTPYLDSFFDSNESLVFDNYYSSGPNCVQTRATLLSGQFPVQHNFLRTLQKSGPLGISIDFPMISEKLKDAGYYTATIGKWHVGLNGDPTYRPENRGFDYSTVWYEDRCGPINCPIILNDDGTPVSTTITPPETIDPASEIRNKIYDGKYFAYELIKQNSLIPNPTVSCHQVYNEVNNVCTAPVVDNYLPNLLTNETTSMLDTVNDTLLATPAHEPFFINLWYYTPHVPANIPPLYHQVFNCDPQDPNPTPECSYQLDYTIETSTVNGELVTKFKETNLCNGDEGINSDNIEKTPECHYKLGNYAAQMTYVDKQIEKVEDKINKMYSTGQLNNETYIIITSDNGGARATHSNWGGDENLRVDSVLCNNGNEPECNIKYRGAKLQLFERGIRVPLAIKRFGAQNNNTKGLSKEFLTSRDFFPTLVNLATETLDSFNYYGIDFSNVLEGNEELSFFEKTRTEFWHMKTSDAYKTDFPTNYDDFVSNGSNMPFPVFKKDFSGENSYKQNQMFAVRQDNWKLIYEPQLMVDNLGPYPIYADETYDLYQIEEDNEVDEYIGSKQNSARPDLVKSLQNQYYKWRSLIGPIDYTFDMMPNMVDGMIDINSHCPNGPGATCDTVGIEHSTRLNIGTEQLSYASYIKINNSGSTCGANGKGVISFKPGDVVDGENLPASWLLKIKNGKLELKLWVTNLDQDDEKIIKLTSDDVLSCDDTHHVAFTIQGSKPTSVGPMVKLFVDGAEVDRHTSVSYEDTDMDNEVDQDLDYCGNSNSTRYCPPHWFDLDENLGKQRIAHSHRNVLIGNNVQKNNIFDGLISPPVIAITTLTNEEIRIMDLTRDMEEDYATYKISYTHCDVSSGSCDGVPVPSFHSDKDAWFFPFDGEDGTGAPNNVVLELKDDPNSSTSFENNLLSFTTKVRLNQFAMKAPQSSNMIAAQTDFMENSLLDADHAWYLKLAPNLATMNEDNDALISFKSWFGSCNLTIKSQGINPDPADPNSTPFAVIKEGETHDIGVSIDKAKGVVSLFLDGEKLATKTAIGNCDEMINYDHMYLGNFYKNCTLPPVIVNGVPEYDDYSCQAFDGLIYAPRISNQLLTEDGFKWESRTQFLE